MFPLPFCPLLFFSFPQLLPAVQLSINPSFGSSLVLTHVDLHLEIARFHFYTWICSAHIRDFNIHYRLTWGISSVRAGGTSETGITLSLPRPAREAPRAIVTRGEMWGKRSWTWSNRAGQQLQFIFSACLWFVISQFMWGHFISNLIRSLNHTKDHFFNLLFPNMI